MLKSRIIELTGRDAAVSVRLTELPALVADRHARRALARIDADLDGGVVALALRHLDEVRALGEVGNELLMPFVDGTIGDRPFNVRRDIRDWKSIERLQQAALLQHVGFLIGRESLEVPVAMQAAQIMRGTADVRVTFCAPFIAGVISAKLATYRELETVLSTEDAYNLGEVLNVDALRDFHAIQQTE